MTFILTESYKKCKDVIKIIKYIFTGLILTEMQLSLYQLQLDMETCWKVSTTEKN